MHTTVTLSAFLFVLTSCSALGINCQGSVVCFLATFENSQNIDIIQGLRDQIYSTNLSLDTQYGDGEHITCVGNNININVGPDEFHLGGSIPAGAVCAFPQDMNGKKLSLAQIRTLADALIDHECSTCGSVPISYLQGENGDVKDGQLTFNFVSQSNADCEGNCISSGHNDGNSSMPQQSTVVSTMITQTADRTKSSSLGTSETQSVTRFTLSLSDSSSASATVTSSDLTPSPTSLQATVTVTAPNAAVRQSTSPGWIELVLSWTVFLIIR